jgi:uncharacterized protein YceH (UPF0502 family)
MTNLSSTEVRVLGSLVEKEITTPDYYPLSLNALTNACNQSSNRSPVVHFDDATVEQALDSLRQKNLIHVIQRGDSRVTKYRHVIYETLDLGRPEIAVMDVLMLRGPQTVGEIRTRTNRLYDFPDLEQVEATLNALIGRQPALAVRLPRQAGQKEVRFAHLLSGEVPSEDVVVEAAAAEKPGRLEERIDELDKQIRDLQSQFDQFRKQFE